jgi:hypothetical protein
VCFAAPPILITQNVDEGKLVTLAGNTRLEANKQNDRGLVADNFLMEHMLLQLKRSPAQEQQLQQFIAQQEDKSSPNFHHWLTAKEFGKRFGLAKQDLDTITRWLESHGFKVNVVYENGVLIDFSGTAGQVRAAFHTEIHELDVKGVKHIANMSDPQIPAALAPAVVGIVSLHDFKPHTNYKPRAHYSPGDSCFLGPCYLVVPSDLATIYNLNPLFSASISGQGQTIVVVEDTDVYTTDDWTTFRSAFGLSSYTDGSFTQIHPAPGSGTNNCTDPGANGDDGEAILDAEYASAAAPSAAIELASCSDTTTFGGLIAIQNLLSESSTPAIMSMSYGECEAGIGAASNAAFNSAFQQAVTEGVSVFASTGDEGPASCNYQDPAATYGIGVSGWASTPYNVAVGGTDFGDTYAGTNSTYWNSTSSSVANFTGGVTNGSTVVTAPAGTFGPCYVGTTISGTDIPSGTTITAVASSTSATMSAAATATDASDSITITSINSTACGSAKSYIPEIPWNDSCASVLIATAQGVSQTYGSDGFCNSTLGKEYFLTTGAGSGGPSGCATGSPSVQGVVGGTCAGYAKPSWQSVVGNPSDGVRDLPDVSLFAANGVWDHYYPFCYSDPAGGGVPCTSAPDTWPGAGGTSFSTPIMAGIQALVNQNAGGAQGNPNPIYYQLAANEYGASGDSSCNSSLGNTAGSSCVFYDVTQGDIDVNCLPLSGSESFNCYFDGATNGVLSTSTTSYAPAFGTTTGWDFATGIGTVNAYNLVNAFAAALADFSIASTGSFPPVSAGQTTPASYQITLAPIGSSTFGENVTFACSFSPTDPTLTSSSCTFNPPSISGTSGGSTPVTMSITTVGPNKGSSSAKPRQRADNHSPRSPWLPFSLPIAGVILAGFAGRRLSRYSVVASLCVALLMLALLVACGGSSTPPISVSNVTSSPAAVYPQDTADSWPPAASTSSLSVTIANDSQNKGVTWTAGLGAIVSTGPTTATYTAPTIVANLPASDTITATSVADSTKSASGSVVLTRATVPNTYTVTITATKGSHVHTQTVSLVVQ